jgi:hypothetical protein
VRKLAYPTLPILNVMEGEPGTKYHNEEEFDMNTDAPIA